MDEKTALQSELRELKAKMELMMQSTTTRNHQNDQINSPTTTNYELEMKLTKLINQRDQLLETIKGQSEQIEHQRRECSNLEAKFVLVQQDRLDSQVNY
jgi:chromosome segregation ATPase